MTAEIVPVPCHVEQPVTVNSFICHSACPPKQRGVRERSKAKPKNETSLILLSYVLDRVCITA